MPKKVEHYLISIPTMNEAYMHAYLMSDSKKMIMNVTNKMLNILEKETNLDVFPVVMATKLEPDGIELVRKLISESNPEAEKNYKSATTFHVTIWIMGIATPLHEKLIALH